MKGKLFVLFIMVGVPTMTWALLTWVMMIVLGILHSTFSVIPALSFVESFLATIMIFAIIIFGASMATDNTRPTRRHDGR